MASACACVSDQPCISMDHVCPTRRVQTTLQAECNTDGGVMYAPAAPYGGNHHGRRASSFLRCERPSPFPVGRDWQRLSRRDQGALLLNCACVCVCVREREVRVSCSGVVVSSVEIKKTISGWGLENSYLCLQSYGDGAAGRCPAPDGRRQVLLEHHVVFVDLSKSKRRVDSRRSHRC